VLVVAGSAGHSGLSRCNSGRRARVCSRNRRCPVARCVRSKSCFKGYAEPHTRPAYSSKQSRDPKHRVVRPPTPRHAPHNERQKTWQRVKWQLQERQKQNSMQKVTTNVVTRYDMKRRCCHTQHAYVHRTRHSDRFQQVKHTRAPAAAGEKKFAGTAEAPCASRRRRHGSSDRREPTDNTHGTWHVQRQTSFAETALSRH
jgi:hypothetical protein